MRPGTASPIRRQLTLQADHRAADTKMAWPRRPPISASRRSSWASTCGRYAARRGCRCRRWHEVRDSAGGSSSRTSAARWRSPRATSGCSPDPAASTSPSSCRARCTRARGGARQHRRHDRVPPPQPGHRQWPGSARPRGCRRGHAGLLRPATRSRAARRAVRARAVRARGLRAGAVRPRVVRQRGRAHNCRTGGRVRGARRACRSRSRSRASPTTTPTCSRHPRS